VEIVLKGRENITQKHPFVNAKGCFILTLSLF